MVSVITTVIHISPYVQTRLQYNSKLDPSSWLYNTKVPTEQIVVLMFAFIEDCISVYDRYRDDFIKTQTDSVNNQQILRSDIIDK